MNAKTITHSLKHPIASLGIGQVTLRPVEPEDINVLRGLAAEGETLVVSHLLARLSGLSFEDFGFLSGEDLSAITDRVEAEWGVDLVETVGRMSIVFSGSSSSAAKDDAAGDTAGDVSPVEFYRPAAGARTYDLVYPRRVDGKWLRRITVRMPEQGDIDDYVSGELKDLRDLLVRLTGLSRPVIRALTWVDSSAVHQIFRDVLPAFIDAGLDV